jgi:hypothetical protein
MRRWDPVPPAVIEKARARALAGRRLGDMTEN